MKHKLSPLSLSAFTDRKPEHNIIIEIDPSLKYQTIIGLGSSLEHSTCYNISLLPLVSREKVLESIVDKDKGIGMNLMRICFGTSDFTASPWSPPAWMKSNKSMCGGRLNPQYYGSFAEYLARSVEAYQAECLDIIAITPQNEPEYFPDSYPTCGWTAEQQRDFIRDHLGPVFARYNLSTKIWCYDHNFNHPNFPETILKYPKVAKYIDGTGFHLYGGKSSAMTWLHQKFPDKHIYFTEGSVFDITGATEIISYFRNWTRCYNAWVSFSLCGLPAGGNNAGQSFHWQPIGVTLSDRLPFRKSVITAVITVG